MKELKIHVDGGILIFDFLIIKISYSILWNHSNIFPSILGSYFCQKRL